jgi:hypothetical protein
LLLIPGTQLIKAGDETQPEFKDAWNDTIEYWDIISGWFQEINAEKETLRITMRMHGFTRIGRSNLIINFTCDDIIYYLNATITFFGIPKSTIAMYDTYNDEWQTTQVKTNIDFYRNQMTFKIPKTECKNLRRGMLITDACATASCIHCHFLDQFPRIHNLMHDTVYGDNYKIKY